MSEPDQKQVSTLSTTFIKNRINHWLKLIDRQSSEKKQEKTMRNLSVYSQEYRQRRKIAGFGWWPATAFATVCVIVLTFAIVGRSKHIYSYRWPKDYLRIIQNIEPCQSDGSCGYTFLMQRVKGGVPEDPVEMHFCRDYQPRWEMGQIIKQITYENDGSCNSIDTWEPLREDTPRLVNGQWQRLPILAPNCVPDWAVGHVFCTEGRAIFEVNPNERRTLDQEGKEKQEQEEAKSARH